jgi:hypothetical protein
VNSNDPWIDHTVLLRVHEEGKRDAHDHAPDEDQAQKVCLMSEGVTNAPCDRHRTTDVDWNLVDSCNQNQIRTQGAGSRNLVPLSYFESGRKAKAEINVGIPMTSPGSISTPPNRSAYTLDDGTMVLPDL